MKDMSKKNFKQECNEVIYDLMHSCYDELNLFCEIMGLPKSEINYFIGDDPHGVVDIMEGYYCFNMTDIHVVISEYEHWLKLYGSNEELRKAVDAWYYYCIDWHNRHSYEEPRWISVEERLPEGDADNISIPVAAITNKGYWFKGQYDYNNKDWFFSEDPDHLDFETDEFVTHWKPIQEAERSKGCPNLRSWLAGCPVDGLREATHEYIEQQRKAQETARQRVEECKQALYQAMEEEVKLNKF